MGTLCYLWYSTLKDVLVEGVLQEKDPSSVRDQLKEMEDIKEYLRAEMV